MKEPLIEKFPTEVFGCPYAGQNKELQSCLKRQYCKFINGTCNKPRKSKSDIKVGICSVGYKPDFMNKFTPVIICPQRFKEEIVFKTIKKKYLPKWKNIEWIPEVSLGKSGKVDYVAIKKNRKGEIIDFLCVEIQASGTTGSPFDAVKDLKKTKKYTKQSYGYGINWANEFSKTMMQQAYKKGNIIYNWKRKIVFVIQDIAIDYLKNATDTKRLFSRKPKLPIDFCTFSLKWNKNKSQWSLKFSKIYSTDIKGINSMLSGTEKSTYPTEDQFISNIIRRQKR